jgi:hypothetical protein
MSLSGDLRINLNQTELPEDEYVNNWLITPNENRQRLCNCCFIKVKRPCLSLFILCCFWWLIFIFCYDYIQGNDNKHNRSFELE